MRIRYRGNTQHCNISSVQLVPENWEEVKLLAQLIEGWKGIDSATFYPASGPQIHMFSVHFSREPEKITHQRRAKKSKTTNGTKLRKTGRRFMAEAVPRDPGRVPPPNLKAPTRGDKCR